MEGRQLLLGFMLMISTLQMNAQSFPYEFSVQAGTYIGLEDGISLNNGMIWDDPLYEIELGFIFNYFDAPFDRFFIQDYFLGGTVSTTNIEAFQSPLMVPCGSDIIDRGFEEGISSSNIAVLVEGEEGSRIAKVEWKNVGFYLEIDSIGISNSFMNFQMWLYEGSDIIEFHFGESQIDDPSLHLFGDLVNSTSGGPLVGLVNNFSFNFGLIENLWYLAGDPLSPEVMLLSGFDEGDPLLSTLTDQPPSGTVYQFKPMVSSIDEQDADIKARLFPTVVNDQLFLEVAAVDHYVVSIQNTLGQTIGSPLNITDERTAIPVGQLEQGTYFLTIAADNQLKSLRFIKSN